MVKSFFSNDGKDITEIPGRHRSSHTKVARSRDSTNHSSRPEMEVIVRFQLSTLNPIYPSSYQNISSSHENGCMMKIKEKERSQSSSRIMEQLQQQVNELKPNEISRKGDFLLSQSEVLGRQNVCGKKNDATYNVGENEDVLCLNVTKKILLGESGEANPRDDGEDRSSSTQLSAGYDNVTLIEGEDQHLKSCSKQISTTNIKLSLTTMSEGNLNLRDDTSSTNEKNNIEGKDRAKGTLGTKYSHISSRSQNRDNDTNTTSKNADSIGSKDGTLGLKEGGSDAQGHDTRSPSNNFPVPETSNMAGIDDNPYMHKEVRIIGGRFEGLRGKVIKIESRGWWTLDNSKLDGHKIHSRLCELIDDVDESVLDEYYAGKVARTRRIPSIFARQKKRRKGLHDTATVDSDDETLKSEGSIKVRPKSSNRKRSKPSRADTDSSVVQTDRGKMNNGVEKRRNRPRRAGTSLVSYKSDGEYLSGAFFSPWPETDARYFRNSHGSGTSSRRPNTSSSGKKMVGENGNEEKKAASMGSDCTKRFHESSIRNSMKNVEKCPPPRSSRFSQKRSTQTPTLPPVLLDPQDDNVIPRELSHLPPDFKIEIFNRKTGRVMSGDQAIILKELPRMLRKHAEFEPVVPPQNNITNIQNGNKQCTNCAVSRQARSSLQTRVNATVKPQSKLRPSKAEGRSVIVTAGPYQGMLGRIESCIPGGWYIVSDLLDEDDFALDVVVHSKNLEVIPKRYGRDLRPFVSSLNCDKTESFKTRAKKDNVNGTKLIRLKINALKDEKDKLEKRISTFSDLGETVTLRDTLNSHTRSDLQDVNVTGFVRSILSEILDKIEHKDGNNHNTKLRASGKIDCIEDDSASNMQLLQLNTQLRKMQRDISVAESDLKIQLISETMLGRIAEVV